MPADERAAGELQHGEICGDSRTVTPCLKSSCGEVAGRVLREGKEARRPCDSGREVESPSTGKQLLLLISRYEILHDSDLVETLHT